MYTGPRKMTMIGVAPQAADKRPVRYQIADRLRATGQLDGQRSPYDIISVEYGRFGFQPVYRGFNQH